jgi:hypothetical protein
MGLLWGILPVGISVLAMFLVLIIPAQYSVRRVVESAVPIAEPERHYVA